MNRLTPAAEEMNHHPDLEISWKTVSVAIITHSEGGLAANDLEPASRSGAAAGGSRQAEGCYARPVRR